MHPIVAWLALYLVLLWILRLALGAWRDRAWFRVLFFPGPIVAATFLKPVAVLCFGKRPRGAREDDDTRPVRVESGNVPCLAGALWFLLAHAIVYLLFLLGATELALRTDFVIDRVSLPEIEPEEILALEPRIELRDYLSSLVDLLREPPIALLGLSILAWWSASLFSIVAASAKQCFWGVIVLLALAASSHVAFWLGLGFPFLTRGWWASIFYFPAWWSLFSLYFTTLLLTVAVASVARVTCIAAGLVFGTKPRPPAATKASAKVTRRKRGALRT